ncbi:unnamed protein product, partial [Mesorhabditis belari]|uniref:Uncharacterized protein n=1 Tax=Mesorhabditis belari TaxID=2138241 RepID=A0AAF3E9G6_9BILA
MENCEISDDASESDLVICLPSWQRTSNDPMLSGNNGSFDVEFSDFNTTFLQASPSIPSYQIYLSSTSEIDQSSNDEEKWQYPAPPDGLGKRANGAGCPPKHNIDFAKLDEKQLGICEKIWAKSRKTYEKLAKNERYGVMSRQTVDFIWKKWEYILKRLRNQKSVKKSRDRSQKELAEAVNSFEKMISIIEKADKSNSLRIQLEAELGSFYQQKQTHLLETFQKAIGAEEISIIPPKSRKPRGKKR